MEYIHFFLTTPICGTDENKYICFDKTLTDKELDNYLNELVQDHIETWIYTVEEEIEEDDYETEEEYTEMLDNEKEWFRAGCYGTWERITKEYWEENEGQFN
jgi:hypothetical protein